MKGAVFLDRDGVINRAVVRNGRPYAPRSLERFKILPDVPEAIASLKGAGFRVIVVTNQPDVAKGLQRRESVEAMHERLFARLQIDDVYACYHSDEDDCACRKPKPGMLLQAAQKWRIHLPSSFMVGDRWRDVEAGRRAGTQTVFLQANYRERQPENPDWTGRSLSDVSKWICSQTQGQEQPQ